MFSRLTGSWIKAITEIFAKISEAVLDRYLAAFALPTNPIRRFYRSRARARAISFSETVSGPCPTEAACRYRWLPTFWTSLAAPSGKASPLKPRSSQNLTQSPASILCSGSIRSCRVCTSISLLASSTALAMRSNSPYLAASVAHSSLTSGPHSRSVFEQLCFLAPTRSTASSIVAVSFLTATLRITSLSVLPGDRPPAQRSAGLVYAGLHIHWDRPSSVRSPSPSVHRVGELTSNGIDREPCCVGNAVPIFGGHLGAALPKRLADTRGPRVAVYTQDAKLWR